MVSVGDGQDGVGAWGRGEPRAWLYFAVSARSLSILVLVSHLCSEKYMVGDGEGPGGVWI